MTYDLAVEKYLMYYNKFYIFTVGDLRDITALIEIFQLYDMKKNQRT